VSRLQAIARVALFQQISMQEMNMHYTKIPHIFQSPVLVTEDGRSGKKVFVRFFLKKNLTPQLKYESTFLSNASRHPKGHLFLNNLHASPALSFR